MEKMDLDVGDEIRLKTKGDSPFICKLFPWFGCDIIGLCCALFGTEYSMERLRPCNYENVQFPSWKEKES